MQVDCQICGAALKASRATAQVELRGTTCYFCCEACWRTFHEHPDLFPEARSVAPRAERVVAQA